MIESFWSTMQRELLDPSSWQIPEQLCTAIRVDRGLVNPRQRHSLGMLSPVEYEHCPKSQRGLHIAAEGAA